MVSFSYSNFFIIALAFTSVVLSDSKVFRLQTNPQIVYGTAAAIGQFPWQVAAFLLDSTDEIFEFCGGSLISPKIVLTAGHCATNEVLGYELLFGGTDLNNMDLIVVTYDFLQHPDYNGTTLANDLALIGMSDPVIYTSIISPVAIAGSLTLPGTIATVSGFGKSSDASNTVSTTLLYATMRTISDVRCRAVYGPNVRKTNICALGYCKTTLLRSESQPCSLQNTCNGDSGGALVVKDNYNNVTKQIGIVSFGLRNGCEKGKPSGYTEVYYYQTWIQTWSDYFSTNNKFN